MANPFLPWSSSDTIYLCVVGGSAIVIFVFWITPGLRVMLKPLKLVVIALHESGHATACILTCGKVEGIEVNPDEGGVTKMRGGVQYCTLPAGYIGSCVWGGLMLFLAKDNIGAQVIAGCLVAMLLAVLFWADNWTLRFLILFFFGLIAGFWALQILTAFEGLQYFIAFMGVMSCLYSIWDVYDDLVRRKVNESDASKFAEKCPCCPAQGWGLLWGLIDIAVMCGSVVAALLVF